VAEARFELFGCRITPIPLIHGHASSTGYRFDDVAYLTDCSAIPEESIPLLSGLDLLIIDALRYTPHSNHFHIATAIAMIERLNPRRSILTHLSHEVPYRDGANLPDGVELAYDGMRIDFP
jgi:phosphoribosyl 1,2-cyclic phosphate phosphodiesterase